MRCPSFLAFLSLVVAPAAFSAPVDRVWVGPMPFVEGRTLRPDFFSTLMDPAAWPTVLARADVFKSYLMVLPSDPLEGKTVPQLSDDDLARLAKLLRDRHIKVAFEVGGLRFPTDPVPEHPGQYTAESELRHLRRWLDAGGTIDYLTTDHAVMSNVGAYYVNPALKPPPPLTLARAIDEQVEYFALVSQAIPGVRVGAIESLGFWEVEGEGGKVFHRTVPALPEWRFDQYLDQLLAAMKQRGLTLDHFHIDFGYEGVSYDGGGAGLNFGRVLAVEKCCHSRGVKTGVIFNAFHDQSAQPVDPAQASREAHDHTLAYFRGYMAAGGTADNLVLQTWMPFPDQTGPEDSPRATLNIARDIIADPSFPAR